MSSSESSSDDDILIKAENVGKVFCRDLKTSLWYGLKDSVGEFVPGGLRKRDENGDPVLRRDEFWANRGISFELRRGECLGLIGHNGAGKTTLLKMLNGLIKPDTGRIEMRGRVGALIALGAGFNPVLTGRENIYVNASVLGLSRRETEEKFDDIVEFSELADFIDTPVRNYSSGMQVRLGFAVASTISPQILLLDEVLAVGDMSFRAKCFNRLSQLRDSGASFILVTHQLMDLSRYATRCLYLEKGEIRSDADVSSAVTFYLGEASSSQGATQRVADEPGTGKVRIQEASFEMEQELRIDIRIESHLDTDQEIEFGMTLSEEVPELLQFTFDSDCEGNPLVAQARSEMMIRVTLPAISPQRSPWFLSLSVSSRGGSELLHKKSNLLIPQKPRPHHFGRAGAETKVEQILLSQEDTAARAEVSKAGGPERNHSRQPCVSASGQCRTS